MDEEMLGEIVRCSNCKSWENIEETDPDYFIRKWGNPKEVFRYTSPFSGTTASNNDVARWVEERRAEIKQEEFVNVSQGICSSCKRLQLEIAVFPERDWKAEKREKKVRKMARRIYEMTCAQWINMEVTCCRRDDLYEEALRFAREYHECQDKIRGITSVRI